MVAPMLTWLKWFLRDGRFVIQFAIMPAAVNVIADEPAMAEPPLHRRENVDAPTVPLLLW